MTSASDGADSVTELAPDAAGSGVLEAPPRRRIAARRLQPSTLELGTTRIWDRIRFAVLVYLSSRLLLFVVAIVDAALRHHSLWQEFDNWDGGWYRGLATDGYPHQVTHGYSTLGFFPLYPALVWVLARPLVLFMSYGPHAQDAAQIAGMLIALVGGGIAAVLVQRLATGWWGAAAGRRATLLFCFFPGSIVFSMVYAEGIMIPLAIGCVLALQGRRWLLAGVLAALATASEPEAAVLVLVCAVSAGLELRRRGPGSRMAWRSVVAPALAPTGLIAVLGFMWAWTGTPRAYWTAQHYGWRERFDPLALPHLAIRLAHSISFAHFNHPTINMNWPVGLIGAMALVLLLALMWRIRHTISPEAWVWTLGVSFIAVTSEWVPPNPRLLITAFPAVIVPAFYLRGRRFAWLLGFYTVLLVAMSAVTFIGLTLRP